MFSRNFRLVLSKYRHYSPSFRDSKNTETLLNLTDSAQDQLKILKQKHPMKLFRIAVESGGCHGFQYKFTLESKANLEEDITFNSVEDPNLKVICDKVSWSMIKEAKLDYSKELIGSTFRIIDNPSTDNGCGCGISFDLKVK